VVIEKDSRAHWQATYASKAPGEVSWFQDQPRVSLDLIHQCKAPLDAPIIDVGGGASTLVDYLLDEGRANVAVLDIADAALDHARARLGARAIEVEWIAADVTAWRPTRQFLVWHDRAVLHFLTKAEDQAAYARTLDAALAPGGFAIFAGFAPGGATRCSGLDVVQHDAASLGALFGFLALLDVREEAHRTPWGSEQPFRYHLFERA
jgi:2-polyprenyl-3-methyl-5-hydroxy-6-metoxy-1,4-benzoquinol methylase